MSLNEGRLSQAVTALRDLPVMSLDPVEPFDRDGLNKRIEIIKEKGKDVEIEGIFEVWLGHDKNNEEMNYYFINDDFGNKIRVSFDDVNEEVEFLSGKRVLINGKSIKAEQRLFGDFEDQLSSVNLGAKSNFEIVVNGYSVLPYSLEESNVASVAGEPGESAKSTLGEQRTALILYETPDSLFTYTASRVAEMFLAGVGGYVRESSYGKAWLKVDVYGPYGTGRENVPFNKIYFPNYTRVHHIYGGGSLNGGGISQVGRFSNRWTDGTIYFSSWSSSNGLGSLFPSPHTAIHEYLHGMGLNHAGLIYCQRSPPWDCQPGEVSDPYEPLSYHFGVTGPLGAVHREDLGWLSTSNVLEIDQTNNFGIYELENLNIKSDNLKVLEIPSKFNYNYYVAFKPCQDPINKNCEGAIVYFVHEPSSLDLSMNGWSFPNYYLMPDVSYKQWVITRPGSPYYILEKNKTFYDPISDVLISVTDVSLNSIKVSLSSPKCGNNKIDIGEECDGLNLGNNLCSDVGFDSGVLKCNSYCKYDTLHCEVKLCGDGDKYIGDRKCLASIKSYESFNRPALKDLVSGIYYSRTFSVHDLTNSRSWQDLRNSERYDASEMGYPGNYIGWQVPFRIYSNYTEGSRRNFSQITRIGFVFNTSRIPDNSYLEDAKFAIFFDQFYTNSTYHKEYRNTHPNSNDFVTLVPFSLGRTSRSISVSDFGRFGNVKNDLELSNRWDLSNNYVDKPYSSNFDSDKNKVVFSLNENGLDYLNRTGLTDIGFVSGYDLYNEAPNEGKPTALAFYISNGHDVINIPELDVVYYTPFFSYIKNNGNNDASGNLILKVQKENSGVWEDIEVVYNGNVAIPANDKLALDSYWNNKAWNANTGAGNYRVYVEFEGLSDSREFFVKGESCGNERIDAGEICDGNELGNFGNGVGKCKQFDSRNVFGDLKCSKSCLEYDSSECVAGTGGECGAGDIKNSDGTCTFSVSSNSSDGTLRLDNTQLKTNWVDFVRNPEASELDTTSNLLSVIMSRASDSYPQNYISRPIVNFDVSKIPQGSRIFRASLKVKTDAQLPAPFSRYVARNYPEDFVSLFRVNLLNSGQISLADFGSFGQEVVDRKDVVRLNGLVRSKEITFNLNKNGLDYLNTNGKVSFGMKSAPEFSNLENLDDYTALSSNMRVYSGNSNNKPRLNITYVPPAPNSLRTCALQGGDICSGSEVCLGNNLISSDSDKCCSVQCTQPQWQTCSQCGNGLFNLCDRQECRVIGQGCYFVSGIISGTCSSCAGATCSNYGSDRPSCENNVCGLQNCNWNEQSNMCYTGFCGNGVKEGAEQCDGDTVSCNVNGNQGTKRCDSQCSGYSFCVPNQRCGDGIKNGNELCDGNDLDGKSCFDFDFDSGDLKCNAQCNDYDFSMCENQQQCVPSPEECDGIDNDCNSFIDEGLGTVSCGTGECRREINACSSGTIQQCVSGTPPQQKETSCGDLKDNDCDGLVDSSDSDCIAQSVCGDSICNGAETCSSCAVDCGQCLNCRLTQAYWTDLSGQGISDTDENMNVLLKVVGVNCNNRGINFTVYEEDLNGGNHFVTKFNSKYSNGTWLTSLGGSGVDYKTYYFTAVVYDAGNTAISSFSSLSNSMYRRLNVNRVVQQNQRCGDGIANATESCDGLDFKGETCQSLGLGYIGGSLNCTSSCAIDASKCTTQQQCIPTNEICNSKDDDCDGQVDELLTQQCGITNEGECQYGVRSCSLGQWGTCAGNIDPVTETCNSKDDDCDGSIDENNICTPQTTCGDNICNGAETCSSCSVDCGSCPTGGQCGAGHTKNADGTCSAVIYVNGSDAALGYWTSASSWDTIRNALGAGVYQLSATESTLRGPQNIRGASGTNSIIRTALPFDTRSIPFGATVISANLVMTTATSFGVYSTTSDYVSVVGLTLNNPPVVSLSDYGRFENLEISNRFDISSQAKNNTAFTFALNSNGLNYVKSGGWSVLGLRGGHDLIGQIGPGTQAAYVTYYSGSSGNYKPRLEVRYRV